MAHLIQSDVPKLIEKYASSCTLNGTSALLMIFIELILNSFINAQVNDLLEPRVNVINMFRLPHRDEIIIHRLRIGHISYACIFTSRGDFPSGLGLSSGFDC